MTGRAVPFAEAAARLGMSPAEFRAFLSDHGPGHAPSRAPDDLLSLDEAARQLGISTKTLRDHVNDGTIPRVVTGRGTKRKHYGFDPADIEAFKRARKEYGSRPCPSTKPRSRRSTPTTSSSTVVGFTALRKLRESATPKR